MNVATLICHRDVAMGIRCLGSLARSVSGLRLVLHDDGTLTTEDIAKLRQALPVQAVVERRFADEAVQDRLGHYPACRRARNQNILMLKLFDVALLGDGEIRYCDTDILFFRPVAKLFDLPGAGLRAVFMHDANHAYSVRPWHLWPGNGLRLPRYLNSGLFVFSRGAFDLDYLEWLLSRASLRRTFAHIPVWAEQTCWAALAFRAGCGLWDPQQLAVVNDAWEWNQRTVAAHFVSSSRARLASMPDVPTPEDVPVTVRVLEASNCGPLTLAKSQLVRRMRRAAGAA